MIDIAVRRVQAIVERVHHAGEPPLVVPDAPRPDEVVGDDGLR